MARAEWRSHMIKKQFDKVCREAGVSWHYDGQLDTIEVVVPSGFVMSDTGLHYRQLYLYGWTRTEAYADLAADLRGGIERCQTADCDICEGAEKS